MLDNSGLDWQYSVALNNMLVDKHADNVGFDMHVNSNKAEPGCLGTDWEQRYVVRRSYRRKHCYK